MLLCIALLLPTVAAADVPPTDVQPVGMDIHRQHAVGVAALAYAHKPRPPVLQTPGMDGGELPLPEEKVAADRSVQMAAEVHDLRELRQYFGARGVRFPAPYAAGGDVVQHEHRLPGAVGDSIRYALYTWWNKDARNTLIQNAMSTDYGFDLCARTYAEFYRTLGA